MNKAFVREPDATAEYCPRCGSRGEPVTRATLATHLSPTQLGEIAATANFCPAASCPVAYFDGFDRTILAAQLRHPVYPKDARAAICACFGFTEAEIDADIQEGTPRRTRALLEKAKSAEARCAERAANGRSCVAYVQKLYLQRMQAGKPGT